MCVCVCVCIYIYIYIYDISSLKVKIRCQLNVIDGLIFSAGVHFSWGETRLSLYRAI